jgi:hypothetical protein
LEPALNLHAKGALPCASTDTVAFDPRRNRLVTTAVTGRALPPIFSSALGRRAQTKRAQMQRTAHISFPSGGLILPAQTPYEQQLVFEHAVASAKRHGRIELSANGRHWKVSRDAALHELCGRCSLPLHDLVCWGNAQSFCGQCMRRALT